MKQSRLDPRTAGLTVLLFGAHALAEYVQLFPTWRERLAVVALSLIVTAAARPLLKR